MVRLLGYLGVIASSIALTLGAPARAQDPAPDPAPDQKVPPRSQTQDAAAGEAYCVGHHLTPTDHGRHDDYVMAIRYLDRYGRDHDGAWRFARREVRRQWTRHETVDGHLPREAP